MDLKDLCKLIEIINGDKQKAIADCPWEIGKKYFIRTVTMHLTGELIFVGQQELVLKDAAWIPDSGRFNEALKDPKKCVEVEPFSKNAIIGRGAVIDATEIPQVLLEVK